MRKSSFIVAVIPAFIVAAVLCGCNKTQKPPVIEKCEFPFHLIYELDGETYDIEDTVVCEFSGFDSSAWFTRPRTWNESLKSGKKGIAILREENVPSVLKPKRIDSNVVLVLDYGKGAYYMGDPNAKSLIHGKPHICYNETYSESDRVTVNEGTALSNKQLEEYFGIKIVEFTFSEPIKNTFEYK